MADANNNGIPDNREALLGNALSGGIQNDDKRQDLKSWLQKNTDFDIGQINRIVNGNANDALQNKVGRLGGSGSSGGGGGGSNIPGRPWLDTPVSDAPGTPTNPGPGGGGDAGGGPKFDQGAFDAMFALLKEYGLESLAGILKNLILDGAGAATIWLRLQETNEWKVRFAGNEILKQNGLGVLSPAEYLALERSYAQIMRNFGLPAGFYDDPSDYAGFIGNNVSAAELQTRVQSYSDLANREDPAIMAQLNSMGLSQGDLLAYMIDPTRAMPLIQQTYQTALIGGAARRAGVVADNDYLKQLAGQGITEQQASQGYGLIAGSLADAKTLSEVHDMDYGMRDMETEIFQNNGQSANKRKRLASQERAAFSGSAGVGNLTRNDAGSY